MDETLTILKQCAKVPCRQHLRWTSEPDGGQSEALNRGIRRATGDLIGWLNSDDRYRPGCFELVKKAFAENPDVDVIYGDYTVMNETGHVLKVRREIEFNQFVLKYHRVLYIPTTATFFRRRIFIDGNWLNEDLHYAMDFDFFVRIAAAGYRFKHIPAFLADMRVHPESKSCAKADVMLRERELLMQMHSEISRKLQFPLLRRAAFAGARATAAVIRYSEKMARGYYHSQYLHELIGEESHVFSQAIWTNRGSAHD